MGLGDHWNIQDCDPKTAGVDSADHRNSICYLFGARTIEVLHKTI